jgi:DNA repair protein RadA/Sms
VGAADEPRIEVGLDELDRVLGGGLVAGSVVLLGGDPGIGKSTLLLQACAQLAPALPVLYVTGEESLHQVALRAHRLGVDRGALGLLAETCVERIIATAEQSRPRVLVIDSVQTVYTDELESSPGAVGQVREASARLVRFAKQSGTAVFLIGHVTKEGAIAGPARARAHGRHRPVLRERGWKPVSDRAGREESLRRRERDRLCSR